jgi:outer membrane protein OmpA-like peptidoglycan-associated protein
MTDSSYLSSNESRLLLDSISVLHSEVNIIKAELASFSDKRTTDQNTLISPDFNTPLNPNEENTSHNSSIILKEKSDTILHLKEENLRLKNELANRVQLSEIMSAKNNSITVSDTIDSPDKNPDETVLPVIIDKRMNIDSLALKSFYSDTILIDESENIDSTLSRPPYPRLIKDDHKSIKDSLNSVAKIEFPESIPKENEDQGKTELNTDLYTRDTLLIAYFHSGETTAFNEEEVLFAVNMIFSTEKVENIFLSAYTDISGTPAINMSISKMRADLIHKKLLDLGIPRELIFMQYFGSTYALQQIDKKDRRVEVLISY